MAVDDAVDGGFLLESEAFQAEAILENSTGEGRDFGIGFVLLGRRHSDFIRIIVRGPFGAWGGRFDGLDEIRLIG